MNICLCMIVKNESRIIERCLDSAKSVIDFVSVCDTGSTDNTLEVIENWCQHNNIPGIVHNKPFKNFGYSRTLSAELAKEAFPEADYLLLLDADMILKVEGFEKEALNAPGYMLMQVSRDLQYWNTRIISTKSSWECLGVTHEFWRLNNFGSGYELDGLRIVDMEDGGSKGSKFLRDERLLLEALEGSLSSELRIRYTFYLAQTYYCLGQMEKSIEWYNKRIQLGGWQEEVYYSYYQIGLAYEHMKDFAKAIHTLTKAWSYRKTRAESLYHVSRICREQGDHNLCVLFALEGKKIELPDDILFVDYHVYDYLLDYELSISGYYSNRGIGLEAQRRLEARIETLPKYIADSVKSNAQYYV